MNIPISLVCLSSSLPATGKAATFFSVAATGLMPYDTQDMSLTAIVSNGVTHGFTVNCQAFVFFSELLRILINLNTDSGRT